MKIFISYSWNDTEKVDEIHAFLERVGVTVIRDIKDFKYKDSLNNFMQRIRTGDYALVYISKNYLESINCMSEALEFQKEVDYEKRILPIIDSDFNISSAEIKIKIIKYWGNFIKSLKLSIKDIEPNIALSLHSKINTCVKIENNIDVFISSVTNLKYVTIESLKENKYQDLLEYIGIKKTDILEDVAKMMITVNDSSNKNKVLDFIYKYPKLPYGYYFSGEFALKEKHYEEALTSFKRSLELYNPNEDNIFNKKLYTRAITRAKCYLIGLTNISTIDEVDQKIFNPSILFEIEGDYMRSLEEDSEDYSLLKDYGIFCSIKKEYNKAISLFDKAVIINNTDFSLYYNRGLSNKKIGRVDDAIDDFSRSIQLNPNFELSYSSRAQLYQNKGDIDFAINDYLKAIDINSNNEKLYYALGDSYEIKGFFDLALKYYTEAIKIKPSFLPGINKRGELYVEKLNNYQKALVDFDFAISLDNDFSLPGLFISRGNVYSRLSRVEEAEVDFKKYISLVPDDFGGYYSLGNLYYRINKYDKALINYDIAIELNNTWSVLFEARAEILMRLGRYDDALKDAEYVINQDSGSHIAYAVLGFVYGKKSEFRKSNDFYNKAVEINPNNVDAKIGRIASSFALGRIESYAIGDLEKILKNSPKNNNAIQLKKSIEYVINNSNFYVDGKLVE